ncbi:tetratricopeptide repeat protein [Streptomyces sp. NPDC054956]
MTRRPPNARLAGLLAEARWSGAELARGVNALGTLHGLGLRYDRTAVAHWLSGTRPRRPVPELIAAALTERCGRLVTVEEAGFEPRPGARSGSGSGSESGSGSGSGSGRHLGSGPTAAGSGGAGASGGGAGRGRAVRAAPEGLRRLALQTRADSDPRSRPPLLQSPYQPVPVPGWDAPEAGPDPAGTGLAELAARRHLKAHAEQLRDLTRSFSGLYLTHGGTHTRAALAAWLAQDAGAFAARHPDPAAPFARDAATDRRVAGSGGGGGPTGPDGLPARGGTGLRADEACRAGGDGDGDGDADGDGAGAGAGAVAGAGADAGARGRGRGAAGDEAVAGTWAGTGARGGAGAPAGHGAGYGPEARTGDGARCPGRDAGRGGGGDGARGDGDGSRGGDRGGDGGRDGSGAGRGAQRGSGGGSGGGVRRAGGGTRGGSPGFAAAGPGGTGADGAQPRTGQGPGGGREAGPGGAEGDVFLGYAQLAHLLGEMTADAGHHGLAQEYHGIALGLARQAGDRRMYAITLRAMSAHAGRLGQPAHAVRLARLAVETAPPDGEPGTLAFLLVQRAAAQARAGERAAAAADLAAADLLHERHAAKPPAGPFDSYARADLDFARARTHLALGEFPAAAEALERSLLGRAAGQHRARALTHAALAETLLRLGHLTRACEHWRAFLTAAPAVQSRAVREALGRLLRDLTPYRRVREAVPTVAMARALAERL